MQIRSLLLLPALALMGSSLSPSGKAEEPGLPAIAVINLTEVFAAHPRTAAATTQLTADREASRKDFKEKSNALKEILQKHQELIRAGKKEAAAEELKKANEAEKAIATLRTTGLRDLEEKFRVAKNEILADIQKGVAEWNESGNYAVILDSSSSSSTGLPQVVHAPGAKDVTAEVIAFLKKRESEKKP